MDLKEIIRSAVPSDKNIINRFLQKRILLHRHLDWRKPTDWLGSSPFLIQFSSDRSINSILNLAPEPENVFWVRLFACNYGHKTVRHWESLFDKGLEIIKTLSVHPIIASLTYQKWMSDLLEAEGWEKNQQVIQFRWEGQGISESGKFTNNTSIRQMAEKDLDRITLIDDSCFQPLWRQSRKAIGSSYAQSTYATVFEVNHSICGFQISTNKNKKAHLARIAVLPGFQRQHIGEQLVHDMLKHFIALRAKTITVNTQEDNIGSIALYEKLKFKRTRDSFPIYIYI